MLFFPITETNLHLILALNKGVQPKTQFNEFGGIVPTYLVVEPEKPTRVLNHKEMVELGYPDAMKTTSRKFHYTS